MHTLRPEERCSLVDQCILGGAGEWVSHPNVQYCIYTTL